MRKCTVIAATLLALTGWLSSPALAGSAGKHVAEGVVLGAGAVLLGTAIIHHMSGPEPVRSAPPRHQGYRETHRPWGPPVMETRWHPGHGRRAHGHSRSIIVYQGYWPRERARNGRCPRY